MVYRKSRNHTRSLIRVLARVREQIQDDALHLRAVRNHLDGLVGHIQVPHVGAGGCLHIRGTFDEQFSQVHGFQLGFAPLVQAREGQQVLHEARHALGLRVDAGERGLPGVAERFGPAQHVGVSLNGRQRRAELVRGVRNEGANLMFGSLAHLQRRVHVIQQLVEGVAHRADLGARVRIAGLHAHG